MSSFPRGDRATKIFRPISIRVPHRYMTRCQKAKAHDGNGETPIDLPSVPYGMRQFSLSQDG